MNWTSVKQVLRSHGKRPALVPHLEAMLRFVDLLADERALAEVRPRVELVTLLLDLPDRGGHIGVYTTDTGFIVYRDGGSSGGRVEYSLQPVPQAAFAAVRESMAAMTARPAGTPGEGHGSSSLGAMDSLLERVGSWTRASELAVRPPGDPADAAEDFDALVRGTRFWEEAA